MMYAIAGQSTSGCSTNYLLKIQHHPSNRVTSASFVPPPKKSWLDKLVDFLSQQGQP